jgi:hypothetical protein
MLKSAVIAHFGSQAEVARFLHISRPSVSEWGEVIPEGAAYKLQVLTAGALRVDPSLYAKPAPCPETGATDAAGTPEPCN